MTGTAIKVHELVKVYGDLRAVDGISFEIPEGRVFAFLGPNGAGKTTTVEIIETIRNPTSGEVEILGMDIKRNRREIIQRIGVLPQEFNSFDRATVRETLNYFSALFGGGRDIDELLGLVNLEGEEDKLYMNLSGGLKQRVGIAVALVNDPEVVFLDEPTTGLDPHARHEVWDAIKGLKREGKTIFLTTHYMEEAEVLADLVAIISKGKIIAEGSPTELIDRFSSVVHLTVQGDEAGVGAVADGMGLEHKSPEPGVTYIDIKDIDQVYEMLHRLKGASVGYTELDVRKANLEEVFLGLTGESLTREGEA